MKMRFSAVSILLIGSIVCGGFDRAFGGLFGNGAPALPANPVGPAPAASPLGGGSLGNAGTALQGAGLANQALGAMPSCQCPTDHSCDNMPMSEMSSKIGGGAMAQGANKGFGGLPLALPGMGKRRRRGIPALGNPAAGLANPAGGGLGGAGNPLGTLSGAQGGSLLASPDFTSTLQNKMADCDKNDQQQQQLGPQIAQGLASGKFNPSQMDMGKKCQDMMNTNKDKCQMMKRQCCSIMNGGLSNPMQLSCSMKDILGTQAQIQAKDQSCKTANEVFSNPSNAGGAIQGAAPGMMGAAVLGGAASKVG